MPTTRLIFALLCLPLIGQAGDRVMRFTFTEPAQRSYDLLVPHDLGGKVIRVQKLHLAPSSARGHVQFFSAKVIIGLQPGRELKPLLQDSPLRHSKKFAEQAHILNAPDALTAAQEAQRLAALPAVRFCHPDMHAPRRATSAYAVKPNDERFGDQFYLEAHNDSGQQNFVSVNAREAWAITRGEGVVIAIGDTGADLEHPDLFAATHGQPHRNFENGSTNSNHGQFDAGHGTAVAGLAAARGYNTIGMAGTAPMASLAIWKMLGQSSSSVIASVFLHELNVVSVQNHSWGWGNSHLTPISELERIAFTNAFANGRSGRGTIFVRSSGNNRIRNANDNSTPAVQIAGDTADDEYTSEPHTIQVAAVRATGRVATYSSPGASVLVAAPSGDDGFPRLFTTDRVGSSGFSNGSCLDFPDCADYMFGSLGFIGTSASAPIVSGIAALIVAANTNLNARDVHQIMALSSRQTDAPAIDTDMQINGAGFQISHNTGYGVPDAGQATRLAQLWSNRPPRAAISFRQTPTNPIPIVDLGHHVLVTNSLANTNGHYRVTGVFPSETRHPELAPGEWRAPDLQTASLPLTFVGRATNDIAQNLTGRAALIERGDAFFIDKLERAEAAVAAFAIIYNHETGTNATNLVNMGLPRINTYPAIFVGGDTGNALRMESETNANLRVQLRREGPRFDFAVTNELIVEQVAVRIRLAHPLRRNLRLSLYSPAGTRSRLQRSLVAIDSAFPYHNENATTLNWTYHSVMHLGESSVGNWLVQIVDEEQGNVGVVHEVELFINGVPITDSDADGLDDAWENQHFGNLAQGPLSDPDLDGYNTAREQLMGTAPNAIDPPFSLNLNASAFSQSHTRFSWPASTNFQYTIHSANTASGSYTNVSTINGRFPATEFFLNATNDAKRFYRITSTPVQ
ncbi:MAG: S8 family serine peptidase [Limisphaerales bacterium]